MKMDLHILPPAIAYEKWCKREHEMSCGVPFSFSTNQFCVLNFYFLFIYFFNEFSTFFKLFDFFTLPFDF